MYQLQTLDSECTDQWKVLDSFPEKQLLPIASLAGVTTTYSVLGKVRNAFCDCELTSPPCPTPTMKHVIYIYISLKLMAFAKLLEDALTQLTADMGVDEGDEPVCNCKAEWKGICRIQMTSIADNATLLPHINLVLFWSIFVVDGRGMEYQT